MLRVGRGHPEYDDLMWIEMNQLSCPSQIGKKRQRRSSNLLHYTKIQILCHNYRQKGYQMAVLLWRLYEHVNDKMFLALSI